MIEQRCVLNVKAVVAAFNQVKALVGAFSMITNLQMDFFEALLETGTTASPLVGLLWMTLRGQCGQ